MRYPSGFDPLVIWNIYIWVVGGVCRNVNGILGYTTHSFKMLTTQKKKKVFITTYNNRSMWSQKKKKYFNHNVSDVGSAPTLLLVW